MGRKILAVIVALVVAICIIMIVQMLSTLVVPQPSANVLNDRAAFREYMANVPATGYLMLGLSWLLGTFAGGFIVTKMSRRETGGSMTLPLIIGIVLTLSAIANFVLFPHPVWFVVVGLLIFIPAALLGNKVAK